MLLLAQILALLHLHQTLFHQNRRHHHRRHRHLPLPRSHLCPVAQLAGFLFSLGYQTKLLFYLTCHILSLFHISEHVEQRRPVNQNVCC
uniref:Uncharacterized protein n=1 Tax=Anguilla anguilla TaxID=7936 RepID=A0A0E9QE73_ANGAN